MVTARGAQQRCRVAVRYALDGDLRYLSHHDEMRMLARALIRARWPLRYSEGFNPIPRLSLPLPRRTGVASDCQWALIELRGHCDRPWLHESLSVVLPVTCTLHEVLTPLPPGKPHATEVIYVATLAERDARDLAPLMRRLLEQEQIIVQRECADPRPPRPLDIRPFIMEMELDGSVLRMRLKLDSQRTARPSEIITALGLGVDAYDYRVRRTAVTWDMELASRGGDSLSPKGLDFVNKEEDDDYQEDQNHAQDQETY